MALANNSHSDAESTAAAAGLSQLSVSASGDAAGSCVPTENGASAGGGGAATDAMLVGGVPLEGSLLAAAIVAQVEFYFSDANLPTDKFMLKQVGKNGTNPVPLKTIAGFKRMKNLSKDLELIAEALRASDKLVVDADGTTIARAEPLVKADLTEIKSRTVAAEGLPWPNPTIDQVTELFAPCGEIVLVRVCQPEIAGGAVHSVQHPFKNDPIIARIGRVYALVEYATSEAADIAVDTIADASNWRDGLRVRKLGKSKKSRKSVPDSSVMDGEQAQAMPRKLSKAEREAEIEARNLAQAQAEEADKAVIASYRGFGAKKRGSLGEGEMPPAAGRRPVMNLSKRTVSTASGSPAVPVFGPRGPDGTKGFGAGRGRPIPAS